MKLLRVLRHTTLALPLLLGLSSESSYATPTDSLRLIPRLCRTGRGELHPPQDPRRET